MANPMVACTDCRFWASFNAHNGHCKQSAPRPTEEADQIAFWPETLDREGCGEGVAGARGTLEVTCEVCVFWQRSPGDDGIFPVDRLGARTAWWREAGHCARPAPGPSSIVGLRGFWRVTHKTDHCGQGKSLTPS